jgi:hypothetical protein
VARASRAFLGKVAADPPSPSFGAASTAAATEPYAFVVMDFGFALAAP